MGGRRWLKRSEPFVKVEFQLISTHIFGCIAFVETGSMGAGTEENATAMRDARVRPASILI
jgi:hypothetical protein